MKKLIYAAGVLSLGGASLAVQAAEGGSKPWTVSLTTQGFYDDNINTQPNGPGKAGSWGMYLSPSGTYAQSWEQSKLNLGIQYGAYYYATVPQTALGSKGVTDSSWSQTLNLNGDFKHNFSPRVSLDLNNNFQLFQNATGVLLGQTGRINGNNIGNTANADLSIELAPRWSVVVGYQNIIYHYADDQYARTLDRMENYGKLDLRYLMLPTTVAVVGVKGGSVNYNSGLVGSDLKDNNTVFAYGGFDHSFTPNFTGSLRAGAEIQDYTNYDHISNQVNPYLDVSVSYAYTVNSSAQLGIIHRSNPTDVRILQALSQESTAVYANVKHAITGNLSGSLVATFQSSQFVGGIDDGKTEDWWSAGATLSYAFTKHISANVAYYYDLVNSQLNVDGFYYRNYNRNRVFFGITATY